MRILLFEIATGALIFAVAIMFWWVHRQEKRLKEVQRQAENTRTLAEVLAEQIIRTGRWDRENDMLKAWLARPKPKNGTD